MHIFNCLQDRGFGGSHIFALKVWDYILKHPLNPEGTLTTISVLLKNYIRHVWAKFDVKFALWTAFFLSFKWILLCYVIAVLFGAITIPLVETLRPKKLLVSYINHFRAELWNLKMTNIPSTQGSWNIMFRGLNDQKSHRR